jgi:leucyl-tRNA synthetase
MGSDGRKMSKRWGNVVNPDEVIAQHGADALRVYEMFMGPFEQSSAWNTNGLVGARKFLEKVAGLGEIVEFKEIKEIKSLLHKTIKKVAEDIAGFYFNTAVSALMILVNKIVDVKNEIKALPLSKEDFYKLLQILAPFAPHLSEELAEKLGYRETIFFSVWPQYDVNLIKDEQVSLVVQVNGRLRANLKVACDVTEDEAMQLARQEMLVNKWLEGKEIIKTVFVAGKLLNIVVK